MKEQDPLVYIIVLNFNGKFHLEYCLPSLLATDYPNFRLVVVDNASTDDSLSYIKENFPQLEVIQSPRNLGWAGGNNLGIRYAKERKAEYVLLANNDIKVHPQWVRGAVRAAQSDTRVGFIGFEVFGDTRPVPLAKFEQACQHWQGHEFRSTEEYVDGMSLFIPMTVFDQLGLIDEGFFVYAEETDLEIRGKAAGFLRVKTNVPVWHYSSGHFRAFPLKGSFFAIRNNMRLSLKHDSLLGILKVFGGLYYKGCSPFYRGDTTDVTIGRLRPRGPLFNFFLLNTCVLWNVWQLPQTLLAKKRDQRRVQACLLQGESDRHHVS
jgi:GT2 family glycosyltransferase